MKKNKISVVIIIYFIVISFTGGFTDPITNTNLPISIDYREMNKGIPFFSFISSNNFASKEIFSVIEDNDNQILMANRRGVIIYNANNYSLVSTPGMPVKLSKDTENNIIYVACNNSFGTLENKDSTYYYNEITKINDNFTGQIDIFIDSNLVYLDYRSFIAIYDKNSKSIQKIYPPANETFGGLVKINNKSAALIIGKGFFNISSNFLTGTVYPFAGSEITVNLHNNNFNLFVTSDNKLYYIEDDKFIEKENKTIEYLEDKIILGGLIIDDYLVAFYTLNGGIAFFDVEKEKIVSVFNSYTGLPENEVFAMTTDKNGGLWIANNFGLFRYDFALPVLNFATYPGIEGKLISSHVLDTNLYVLTTKGVYYLTKPKSDQEFEDYLKKQQAQIAANQSNNFQNSNTASTTTDNEIIEISQVTDNNTYISDDNTNDDQDNKNNNIFKRWSKKIFKKKNRNNQQDTTTQNNNQLNTDTLTITQADTLNNNQNTNNDQNIVTDSTYHQPQNVYVPTNNFQTDKQKQFSDLYYIYKKVEDINTKCKQAVSYNNKLFVSTNSGLFIIEENKATKIIEDEYITTIQQSVKNENILFIATINSLYSVNMDSYNHSPVNIFDLSEIDDYVFSITETDTAIWLGGEGFAYRIGNNSKNAEMFPISPDFLPIVKLINLNNNLFCYTPQGIYKQNTGIDSITIFQKLKPEDAKSVYFIKSQKNIIWYLQGEKWKYQSSEYTVDSLQLNLLRIIPAIKDIKIDNDQNLWVVSENNSLYKISNNDTKYNFNFELNIQKFSVNDVCRKNKSDITVDYTENSKAKFELIAPFYIHSSKIMYQYSISTKNNEPDNWSDFTTNNKFEIPLVNGTQFIHFRAKNVLNEYSTIKTFKITVKPPFWKTTWFNLIIVLTSIGIINIVAILRQRALKKRNEMLEYQVKIRTAKIKKQNEELRTQSEEIKRQNLVVSDQRDEILKTNDYITQSINYARRIQKAILPAGKILLKHFSDYLIISKPRDIVSGDFYWTKEYKGKMYLSVADCTGHGVPGAFLSMLGTAYLNEITTYKENLNSALILNSLRQSIIYALQEKEENSIRDGMDISFTIFDFEQNTIDFAGAYHSLYLLRRGEIIIYKGDRMPIGYSRKNNVQFTSTIINFEKDDVIYLFTDGYPDQFGEKNKSKFMLANFRRLLKSVGDVPLSLQKELLKEAFAEWKGESRQIDDVTIVAVKI